MLCICQNSQNFADKERTLVCANSENRLGGYGIPGRNTERDKRSEACCRRMRQPPGVGGGQGSLTRLTLGTERACHPSPLPPGACGSRGATPIRGLQTPAFRAPGTPRASELCQEKVAVEDQGKDMDRPLSLPTWILTHAPVSKETGTVPHPEGPSLQPAGCAPTASLGAECLQRWPALQATPSLGQPAARPQQDGVRSVERVMDTFHVPEHLRPLGKVMDRGRNSQAWGQICSPGTR